MASSRITLASLYFLDTSISVQLCVALKEKKTSLRENRWNRRVTEKKTMVNAGINAVAFSVPHATCPPLWQYKKLALRANTPPGHYCDTTAPRAATLLRNVFQSKLNGPDRKTRIEVFPSHVPRYALWPDKECDMNRVRCRYTDFRQQLRDWVLQQIHELGNEHVWLFDVHSFTPHLDAYGPHDAEIVLLDHETGRNRHSWFTDGLANFLRQQGIDVLVLKGAKNDINLEMRALHLRGEFLIEFNEELATDRMRTIARAVAEWLFRVFTSQIKPKPTRLQNSSKASRCATTGYGTETNKAAFLVCRVFQAAICINRTRTRPRYGGIA